MSKFIKIKPRIPFSNNEVYTIKYVNVSTIEEIDRSDSGGTFIKVNYSKIPYNLPEKFEDFINRLNNIVNE